MRFWDSSSIVPLILAESTTGTLKTLIEPRGLMMVWWGTPVEVVSAMARRVRDGVLDAARFAQSRRRLEILAEGWQEVAPSDHLRGLAERAVRVHELRAADAFQLAAAMVVAEGAHSAVEIVTLDRRLRDAALRESFRVLPT
jgi:predicted nucleic acid-binding protein